MATAEFTVYTNLHYPKSYLSSDSHAWVYSSLENDMVELLRGFRCFRQLRTNYYTCSTEQFRALKLYVGVG